MTRMLATLLAMAVAFCGCTTPYQEEAGEKEQRPQDDEEQVESGSVEEPEPKLAPVPAVPEGSSLVFVQDSDGTDDGVLRLIRSMEKQGLYFYRTQDQPSGLFGPEDVVLLKINCQWAERGGTNTDLLGAVVEALARHPEGFEGEIVVADNGQGQYGTNGTGGSLEWSRANAADTTQSAMDVIGRFQRQGVRISGYLWDDITQTRVAEYDQGDMNDGYVVSDVVQDTGAEIAYPKFTTEYGTRISFKEGVWLEDEETFDSDRLCIINMPVLKSHSIYYVTGAVKAYMGVTSDKLTGHRAHQSVGSGSMGTLMAGTRMPTLNLMDMIWVGADQGPGTTYQTAVAVNKIAASTDPVAIDAWASKHVLIPEAEKLPGGRAASMDPEGAAPGTFGYWLRLSAAELRKAGFQVAVDQEAILAYAD